MRTELWRVCSLVFVFGGLIVCVGFFCCKKSLKSTPHKKNTHTNDGDTPP